MMRSTKHFSRLIILAMTMVLLLAGGCKSKKKAMEAADAAAQKAKMEQEAATRKQREEEQRLKEEDAAKERARQEAEARAKAETVAPAAKLGQYFSAIANAGTPESANNSIREALALFATDETPVLIVISESGGQKDYDRPTTIKAYLNYLKDQKKNINPVSDLEFDASGKITSVELRKQN